MGNAFFAVIRRNGKRHKGTDIGGGVIRRGKAADLAVIYCGIKRNAGAYANIF